MPRQLSSFPNTAILHNKIMPYREPLFELLVERGGVDIFLFEGDVPNTFAYPDAVSKITKNRLFRYIWQRKYDVVVNPDVVYSETHIAGLAAMVSGIGVVQWTETWAIPNQPIKELLRTRELLRFTSFFADEYVVPGVASEKYVRNVTSTEPDSIHQMGSPTHIIRSIKSGGTADSLIPDDDTLTVLFLAQVTRRKGIDTVIDAMATVSNTIDCRLVIGGKCDPSYRKKLATRITQLGLDTVDFLGWIPEDKLFACYEAADVYVLPSRADPWAISVVEAMKAGTPVVVSDAVGAAWDLVDGHQTGYIVPVDNSRALADRLSTLLLNPNKRASMGENAAKLVAEKMTYDRMAASVENAIRAAAPSGADD